MEPYHEENRIRNEQTEVEEEYDETEIVQPLSSEGNCNSMRQVRNTLRD